MSNNIYMGMPLPQRGALVSSDVMRSVAGVMRSGVEFATVASTDIWRNRDALVARFLDTECQGLFMVDSDMVFGPDTLERLVALSADNPDTVVTGLAVVGHPPHHPAAYRAVGDELCLAFGPHDDLSKPLEVDAVGSYGLLIPRSVVETLWGKDGTLFRPIVGNHRGQSLQLGEDFSFCRRVQYWDFKIICDPSIRFGHLRPIPLGLPHWDSSTPNRPQPWIETP